MSLSTSRQRHLLSTRQLQECPPCFNCQLSTDKCTNGGLCDPSGVCQCISGWGMPSNNRLPRRRYDEYSNTMIVDRRYGLLKAALWIALFRGSPYSSRGSLWLWWWVKATAAAIMIACSCIHSPIPCIVGVVSIATCVNPIKLVFLPKEPMQHVQKQLSV